MTESIMNRLSRAVEENDIDPLIAALRGVFKAQEHDPAPEYYTQAMREELEAHDDDQ